MIAVVLAAGYGTRISCRIGDTPKALIRVENETLIGRIFDQLEAIDKIDKIVIVSNDLFYSQLEQWLDCRREKIIETILINNGTRAASDRLGAIRDLHFCVDKLGITEPVFVIASDCIFNFSLKEMLTKFDQEGGNWIAVSEEDDKAALTSGAEIRFDSNHAVTFMREKPDYPESNYGALPFYIFENPALQMIEDFLEQGGDPDSPGRFPEWLHSRDKLWAFVVDKSYFFDDLGTPEKYDKWTSKNSEEN